MSETTSPAETLAAVFNRVCDRVENAHGPALHRAEKYFARPGEEPFLAAVWCLGGLNHGFKLYATEDRHSNPLARLLTWAHAGPLHHATVVVAPELVEELLLAVLPPAIRPPAMAREETR